MKKNLILFVLLFYPLILFSREFSNQKTNNALTDKVEIKKIIDEKEAVNWVFTGNSITQGAKHTHGMRSFPEIFSERIRWEMGRANDFVINTAISGNTTQNILNDFDKRITQFNPKIVVLMIGTNDAAENKNISLEKYAANLNKIIDKVRTVGAIPILIAPNIIVEEKAPERKTLSKYVEKMREISVVNGLIFIDIWHIWKTDLERKYDGKVCENLLNDPLHPNGFGHQEIARALFRELSIFDELAPTCGGEYYKGEL